jgi:putative MFS transporter
MNVTAAPSSRRATNDETSNVPRGALLQRITTLLSLSSGFETYNLALTATLGSGLIRSGVFHVGARNICGLSDPAVFALATFAGLFLGAATLGLVAERFGRRSTFVFSISWYTITTLVMGLQQSPAGVDFCRFLTGVGIGLQLATLDDYVAALVPQGRWDATFAASQGVQFFALIASALSSWLFLPRTLLGIAGWRWLTILPACASPLAYYLCRLPPGFARRRQKLMCAATDQTLSAMQGLPKTVISIVLNLFCCSAFYGVVTWLPTLLVSRRFTLRRTLTYTFVISLVYPIVPLLVIPMQYKMELKSQIILWASGIAVTSALLVQRMSRAKLVRIGLLLAGSSNWVSFTRRAHREELDSTCGHARIAEFVYSFSRISSACSGFVIAALLRRFGFSTIALFIACSMVLVILVIGIFGPDVAFENSEARAPEKKAAFLG